MPMDGRLYRAAQSGDMKVLREYKDQLTTQFTPYKNTVLHIAAHSTNFSSEDAGEFLVIFGPELPALLFRLNSNGDTCIHVAARKDHFNLIEALIGYMKPNSPGGLEAGIESVHELLRIFNSEGNMALHEAVMHRRHRVVEMLVREDANFTHPPNKASKSPLFLAMEKKDEVSAEVILIHSSSPSYAGPYGTTALHAAALIPYGADGCLEMILKKEPRLIKQVDDMGWSPLHFAAFLGSSRTVRVLLKKDKQMAYETIKEDNKTPLHLAALNDRFPAVKEIIEQCPDSDEAVTSHRHNALRLARLNGSKRVGNFYLGFFHLMVQFANDLRYANQSSDPSVVIHHPYLEQTDIWWRVTLGKEVKNELAEGRDSLKERRDSWKERRDTHLLVAILITTISFAAGFTIPGGYDDDDGSNKGMAILARKTAFKAFVVTDTLALIFSTFAVLLHFNATFKRGTMRHNGYFWAAIFIMIAMLAMMIAFTTGLYVVLPFKGLAIGVCVMCSVSLCSFMMVFDVQGLFNVQGLFVYGKNRIYAKPVRSVTEERKKQVRADYLLLAIWSVFAENRFFSMLTGNTIVGRIQNLELQSVGSSGGDCSFKLGGDCSSKLGGDRVLKMKKWKVIGVKTL